MRVRERGSVDLAVPCVSGGGPGMPKGRFGWLAGLDDGRLLEIDQPEQCRAAIESFLAPVRVASGPASR